MINAGSLSILLAEDDEADVLFIQRAFKHVELPNPVYVVSDGFEAIEALSRTKTNPEQRLPGLVILDLKMPRRTGLQVLEWMRQQPVIRSIPVLILSSSTNQSDVESAYERGASGFMIKPPSVAERNELARFIKDWMRLIQPPLTSVESFRAAQMHRAPLFGESSERPAAVP
jgi:CheY-like chemotaxis protein